MRSSEKSGAKAKGIFADLEYKFANRLGLRNLRHRGGNFNPSVARAPEAFSSIFSDVDSIWHQATTGPDFRPSGENFRWFKPQLAISEKNRSPEVTLERAIVRACDQAGRKDWANQVPLISGLAGKHAYKRRAVDLVQYVAPNALTFVELKIDSDTPLYAAAEITIYSMLWLVTRRDRARLGLPSSPLLGSRNLNLVVLAPGAFYRNFECDRVASFFCEGLSALAEDHDIAITFKFSAFSDTFSWPSELSDPELLWHFENTVLP